jgi:hypothetical protein
MIVYHLLKAEWALDNINKKRVKIAEIGDLNDPFELSGPDLRDKEQRKQFKAWRAEIAARYGMVCFSRNWNNPVLWSHYADKHRGIALGFEVSANMLMDVIYTSTRLSYRLLKESFGNQTEEKYVQKLLLTKYTDWAYEDEVRIFTSLDKRDKKTRKYYQPFSSDLKLREVIVGPLCNVSGSTLKQITSEYAETVSFIKARLAFGSFRVVKN